MPLSARPRVDRAEAFVRAAAARGVTAIAVTDDHDVCMPSYVEAAAQRLDSGILVYAGIAFAFGFGDPYLPTSVRLAPSGPMWWHEIKYVGYWPMVRRTASRVRIARGAASTDSR